MEQNIFGRFLLIIMLSSYLSSCAVAASVATNQLISRTTKAIDSKLKHNDINDRKGSDKEDKRRLHVKSRHSDKQKKNGQVEHDDQRQVTDGNIKTSSQKSTLVTMKPEKPQNTKSQIKPVSPQNTLIPIK